MHKSIKIIILRYKLWNANLDYLMRDPWPDEARRLIVRIEDLEAELNAARSVTLT